MSYKNISFTLDNYLDYYPVMLPETYNTHFEALGPDPSFNTNQSTAEDASFFTSHPVLSSSYDKRDPYYYYYDYNYLYKDCSSKPWTSLTRLASSLEPSPDYGMGYYDPEFIQNPFTTPGSPTSTISDTFPSASSSTVSIKDEERTDTSLLDSAKKIHSCEYCHRKFARKYDVKRHSRIHTGKKPYVCFCCHKSFSRSDALNRHIRKEPFCLDFSEKHGPSKNSKRQSYL
ncbi:hypothetical protein BY458DRAFT_509229 [Sporodiniella umbellata]|nr:hypothetical protein BY458DRAFT_509229 [Sporodiniella umbellata]